MTTFEDRDSPLIARQVLQQCKISCEFHSDLRLDRGDFNFGDIGEKYEYGLPSQPLDGPV